MKEVDVEMEVAKVGRIKQPLQEKMRKKAISAASETDRGDRDELLLLSDFDARARANITPLDLPKRRVLKSNAKILDRQ